MNWLRAFGTFTAGALALVTFSGRADAQQEFYGYKVAMSTNSSAVTASAVAAVVQPPGCAPTPPPQGCVTLPSIGCNVSPCPPPNIDCPPSYGSSVTHSVCVVLCDQPPTNPAITLTITRNYYLPINIRNNTTPNVVPVNLRYQWQPIHYLSNDKGEPVDQNGQVLPNPPGLIPPPGTAPSGIAPSPQTGSTDAPAPPSVVASNSTAPVATVTPAAPTTGAANSAAKQWVWLQAQGLYGYGYRRPDGYWVLDKGSKRSALPAPTSTPSASTTPTALTTTAAVK